MVSRKVTAATLGAAVATLIAAVLSRGFGVTLDPVEQGALTTILTFGSGWLRSE